MSDSNKFLSDYAYLAEASYTDFSKPNVSDLDAIKVKKPENFATLVTDNYDVVAHYTNRDDESGFSGTLFKNKQNPLTA